MKTKPITGVDIIRLKAKIIDFSDHAEITAVDAILLDHALTSLDWAANYCDAEDIADAKSEIGADVIAHYETGRYLAKIAAGIR